MGTSLFRLLGLVVVYLFGVSLFGNGVGGRSLLPRDRMNTVSLQDICVEPSCVLASASILKALDTSVDPCQDFYLYACGGWLELNDITMGRSSYHRFEEVDHQIVRTIRKLLERTSNVFNGKESEAVGKAKDFYKACLNIEFVEKAGGHPLKEVLQVLGGWSLLDDGDLVAAANTDPNSPISMFNYLGRFKNLAVTSGEAMHTLVIAHKLAVEPLFAMSVSVDDKNSSAHIITFYQAGLQLLSPEFYNDTELADAYVNAGAMTALLLKFGELFDPEGVDELKFYGEALERMKQILAFETELAKAFSDKLEDPVRIYHKMTIEEFAASIPAFNVSSYLNQMFDTTVPDDEDILVYTPDYFVSLNGILQQTSEDVVKDYIVWQTIFPMLSDLSSPFRQVISEFDNIFHGSAGGSAPLWDLCVSRTQDAFGEVTGALFVQELIPYSTRDQVGTMLKSIRNAFIENLPTIEWMEESTKAKAYKKARTMNDKIGWPDWLLDPEQLDEKLKEVMVDPDDQFLNMMWLRIYIVQENTKLRGQPVDKTVFYMNADTVNAYYSPSENEMVFPAGILQKPFYSSTSPTSVNYGAMGVVMGHELTHGFDNNGRNYDQFGNLNDWWDDKSEAKYNKRAKCMEHQYNNYTVEGIHIDGLRTLGENIADNGGIRAAFKAFKYWLKSKPGQTEPRFPGLQEFSPEQLFFIGSAQVWCTKETPESARIRVLTNEHAPSQIRVKGMLTNMPEFAEVFQCPHGSPMSPDKDCRVW